MRKIVFFLTGDSLADSIRETPFVNICLSSQEGDENLFVAVGVGFDSRDRFEFVDEAVANLVELPDFVELSRERGRLPLELFSKSPLVSEGGEVVVEHFVVSYDAFVRRTSFEFRKLVQEPFGIFGLEFDALGGSDENERRSKEDGNGDEKDDGEF